MKHSGPFQPRLSHESPLLYLPSTGTDATGRGLGAAWTRDGGSGTVSHPALGNTFVTEMPRTRITSTAASNNELGVRNVMAACWRGNAASRGGFYFSARFLVQAVPATSVRFFAGLTAGTGAGVCVSDTVPNNSVGLWCDSGDASSLSIVTKGTGSATKTALTTPETLTVGRLYEFVMICNPNQSVLVTNLINFGTDALLTTQNVSATMPTSTVFMAPQVGLSNAANAAGGDTALDIISVYARPNHRLVPAG